ncbi:MAG: hypothetical protein DI598_04320 [Pseudopedobacter saltans]|uniref:Lipoprotein n=1 Tax=Pseudopedobacter saltans TaxID=151895 RepID=A0A2W5FBI7_9SPHI|nr:MAG: hypothetical protein DI598_04320 [Pseudopedobacter saltans]
MKPQKRFALLAFYLLLFSSCYSVRVVVKDGVPEPAPPSSTTGFYAGKEYVVIDTTIKLGLADDMGQYLIKSCNATGLYAVEYRVTLGDILLNGITFGKHRKLRVKYICSKSE